MTAILKASMRRDPIIVVADRPRRVTELDLTKRQPIGGTINLSPGADIGQAIYDNPDATIICAPGVYPQFKLRKPPGHGYTTVRTPTLPDMTRRSTPSDIASGIQVIPAGDQAGWQDSQIEGEIPYKINLINVHPTAPATSQAVFFFGIAMLASEAPPGLKISNLPWDIVLYNCVHTMPDTAWRRWALLGNGVQIGAVNSWFGPAHFQLWPLGYDSNGIGLYQGPGPFTFKNCFISGAEEHFAIGDYGNGVVSHYKHRSLILLLMAAICIGIEQLRKFGSLRLAGKPSNSAESYSKAVL
jgi:hypothetical protein